jgi:hypothetical protein
VRPRTETASGILGERVGAGIKIFEESRKRLKKKKKSSFRKSAFPRCHFNLLVITGRQRPASGASGLTLSDPVIQADRQRAHGLIMDGRVKPGYDEFCYSALVY